ncbi:uncharacterized protein RHO17_003339 [Thomomys bottae]
METPYCPPIREFTTPMMHVPKESLPSISRPTIRHAHLDEEHTRTRRNTKNSRLDIDSYSSPSHGKCISHHQDHQVTISSEELHNIIENIMTWVVSSVTNILYPVITKHDEK